MSEKHGMVWWSELNTRDQDKAKSFYGPICGWTFNQMEMDGGQIYVVAMQGERPMAGFFDMTAMPGMEEMPEHWFTYLAVDDVEKAVEQTKSSGGTIMREPFDVPGVGRIAIVADAGGAAVGIMTPADPPG